MSQVLNSESFHPIYITTSSQSTVVNPTLESAREGSLLGRIVCWIKESILDPIGQLFAMIFYCLFSERDLDVQFDTVQRPFRPTILPAPAELTPAADDVISRPLVNLGATCYMNSVLQMIARLNAFNGILTNPIEFSLPNKLRGEAEEAYVLRVQRAQDRHDRNLPARKALQGHLCAIIQKMRSLDSQSSVSRQELMGLFCLLQKCGWRASSVQQQDPQELIAFLKENLGAIDFIQQLGRISYEKDGEVCFSDCQGDSLDEIAVPLPVSKEGQLLPQFDTIEKLIDNFSHDSVDYTPVKGGPCYLAEKHTYFIGNAPEAIFVQQKRFGYDPETGQGNRLNCKTPFSEVIKVPFYEDLSKPPVEHTYRLKVVIGHGGGTSINSGHYTAMALHKDIGEGVNRVDRWVLYDDGRAPKFYHPDPANQGSVVGDITKKAYYLAYERVDAEISK